MATLSNSRVIADCTLKNCRAELGKLLLTLLTGKSNLVCADEAHSKFVRKVQALRFLNNLERNNFISELTLWIADARLPIPDSKIALNVLLSLHRNSSNEVGFIDDKYRPSKELNVRFNPNSKERSVSSLLYLHQKATCKDNYSLEAAPSFESLHAVNQPNFYEMVSRFADSHAECLPQKLSSWTLILYIMSFDVNWDYCSKLTLNKRIDDVAECLINQIVCEDMDICCTNAALRVDFREFSGRFFNSWNHNFKRIADAQKIRYLIDYVMSNQVVSYEAMERYFDYVNYQFSVSAEDDSDTVYNEYEKYEWNYISQAKHSIKTDILEEIGLYFDYGVNEFSISDDYHHFKYCVTVKFTELKDNYKSMTDVIEKDSSFPGFEFAQTILPIFEKKFNNLNVSNWKEVNGIYKSIPQFLLNHKIDLSIEQFMSYLSVDYYNYYTTDLFYHLGTGNNIRTYQNYGQRISKKAAHVYHNLTVGEVKGDYSFFYAHCKSLGLPEELIVILQAFNRMNNQQFMNYSDVSFANLTSTILFLKNESLAFLALNSQERAMLVGYISHCFQDVVGYSLKGRTTASVLRRATAWYEENQEQYQRIGYAIQSWKGAPYQEWHQKGEDNLLYAISQLTKQSQLDNESSFMSHCVRGYGSRCATGQSSIWSLRVQKDNDWVRLATFEVNNDKQIVQIKGKYNVIPDGIYLQKVKTWADENGLTVKKY
jgi:PcfJ-like protein